MKRILAMLLITTLVILNVYGIDVDVRLTASPPNTIVYTVHSEDEKLKNVEVYFFYNGTQYDYRKVLMGKEWSYQQTIDKPGNYSIKVVYGTELKTKYIVVDRLIQKQEESERKYNLIDPKIAYSIGGLIMLIFIYSAYKVLRVKKRK